MQIFLRVMILMLVVSTSCVSVAQPAAGRYSSSDKKALKKFEEGLAFYDRRQSTEALESFQGAIKADPGFIEAHLMCGSIYEEKKDYKNARAAYEAAIKVNPSYFPNAYYTLGKLELKNGDYKDAQVNFETFLKFRTISASLEAKARVALESCDFAIAAKANPVPFDPINLGPNINSSFNEYFPSLTADDQTMLYTRAIESMQNGREWIQEDFFITHKDGANKWEPSTNMGQPINTESNEGAPTLSADGSTMIFAACHDGLSDPAEMGSYGGMRNGKGSCDLFYTFKVGANWTPPRNLSQNINSYHWETQPSFSADGTSLYFIRSRKNQDGVLEPADIFVSTLTPEGMWSKAEKLGPNINTPGHEASVLIHPDGQTLYFASDGHPGMGGLDIYMSRRQPNGEWGKAINLGYPINTHNDENSLLVSTKGDIAYFASNREGGLGGLDLYSFEMPATARPGAVTYLKGKVFDKTNKRPLEASFELIDLATGEVVIQSYSNSGSGNFLVSLPAGKDYALNVSRNGYMFYSDNFQMGEGSITEPFLKDIPLTPIEVADPEANGVVLKNVYFETAKFDLVSKSKVELDKLVQFLKQNASLHIELSGHTDDRGGEKENQILSENRAKEVRSYLITNGIAAERLTAVGWGESRPIADNTTDEGRAQNRRTEYKITKK